MTWDESKTSDRRAGGRSFARFAVEPQTVRRRTPFSPRGRRRRAAADERGRAPKRSTNPYKDQPLIRPTAASSRKEKKACRRQLILMVSRASELDRRRLASGRVEDGGGLADGPERGFGRDSDDRSRIGRQDEGNRDRPLVEARRGVGRGREGGGGKARAEGPRAGARPVDGRRPSGIGQAAVGGEHLHDGEVGR